MTTDDDILQSIRGLVDEEHALRSGPGGDRERLQQLEQQLDQCWDLLRQRRARREFDQDPDQAAVRSAGAVEGYRQ